MGIVILKSGDFQALISRIEAIEKYIYQTKPENPPLQEIWLDNEAVCAYLKISKRTLQRYRSNRVIAYGILVVEKVERGKAKRRFGFPPEAPTTKIPFKTRLKKQCYD